MKQALLFLIKAYQKTLSFDHGPMKFLYPNGFCKFYPSCSQYAYQAIKKHGAQKGCFLSLKRLFKCNPWSSGGNDPVL